MKLISMHVDDFGGLHNYDYNFEEGLNVVLHDNGWGKTTMAAFLKAMLYGFDSKRSKDITENERKRYLPWQGGKYGGSLDFEAEGVRYRILRSFGETPRFDKTRIVNLDKNVTAKIDPEKIGETLFKLDASAFQRSVFINQNGLSIDGAASSIHTRLNALVSQANDVSAFDGAIKKLTEQTKVYEKTGNRGQIGDITRKISELEYQRDKIESEISKQDEARQRISEIDSLVSSIEKELKEKKERLEKVSGETKKREAAKELLDGINQQIAELQGKIDAVKAELGGEVPTQTEIDEVKQQKQNVASLTAQLKEVESDYAKLTADYNLIIRKYNGTLPTTAQLNEVQQAYSDLQGVLSTKMEDASAIEPAPEGYDIIKSAIDTDPNYISKLRNTISSQGRMQDLVRRLDSQERDIHQEEQTWGEKKERYAGLAADTANAKEEISGQQQYAPAAVGSTITGLDNLQKKQRNLTQQKNDLDASIAREAENWAEKKKQYVRLREEVDQLKPEVESHAAYSSEKVGPIINKLENIQRAQQKVELKHSSLADSSLTAEQESLLAMNEGELPNAAEGSGILKKYRSALSHQAEIQGLSAKLEGENSKADSLKSSIEQLNAASGMDISPIEEPKKPAGGVMIGAGAALAVIGVILLFVVSPIMAIVAVAGIALAVFGVVSNNSYKTKVQAYDSYKAAEAKRQENEKKKSELQTQLDSVLASVSNLEEQSGEHQRQMGEDNAAVAAWMKKWASGAEPSELAISQVIDNAEKVRSLRTKKQKADEIQRDIEKQNSAIEQDRSAVDAQYPELAGKSADEALKQLRSAEIDYKLKAGKLQTAVRNLQKFIGEAKISETQFASEESPRIPDLRKKLAQAESDLEGIEAARKNYDAQYPEIAGLTYDDALNLLRGKQSAYSVANGKLQAAVRAENTFLSQAKVTSEQLALEESPRMAGLIKVRNETADDLLRTMDDANEVLSSIGITITTEDAQRKLRKADQMLTDYKQQVYKLKGLEERRENRQRQIESLQRKLGEKLPALRGRYADMEVPERVKLIRGEVSDAAILRGKIHDAEEDKNNLNSGLAAASDAVNAFIAAYGQFKPETDDILPEIYAKAASYTDLQAAMGPLEDQRAGIEKEQSEAADQVSAEESELKRRIGDLEKQRDGFRDEYTKKSDLIRQADNSLEQYPDVIAEIRQQYDQKQKAQNTLIMLKRTIQLITKAKENLANRYLSKVEQRFNNYMHIWLNNDAVRGILDIDFNITIEENDKVHVAEGYSTGYCDLIDFCMRLALVDTLFENEQPFLILDDPFVNLDVDRLDKALELLNVMAANKQIVYFVCHPIRAVEADENSSSRAEFVQLAEATRKTIEGHRSSGTEGRKIVRKSPKEMYKVVSTGRALAIKPAKPNYTITNNIFSMNFVPDETEVMKDVSYELFFIDAKGRVLNERQSVEVKDHKLSVGRVHFCLNSREDSGDQYELMIRESGQDDYAVVARIPFKAKLAFAGTDSFEF